MPPARRITTAHSSKSTDQRRLKMLVEEVGKICHTLKETTRIGMSVEATRTEEEARRVGAVAVTKMTVAVEAEVEGAVITMTEVVKTEEVEVTKVEAVALEAESRIRMIVTAIETTTSVVEGSRIISNKGLKQLRPSTRQNLSKSPLSHSSLKTSNSSKRQSNSTSQRDRSFTRKSKLSTKLYNHSLSTVTKEELSSR